MVLAWRLGGEGKDGVVSALRTSFVIYCSLCSTDTVKKR